MILSIWQSNLSRGCFPFGLAAWVLLVLSFVWVGPTDAKPVAIEIVLDASASMKGPIEGRRKIEIAKDALRDLLNDLPVNTVIGLRAFGHQRCANTKRCIPECATSELLVPLGSGNAPAVEAKLKDIQPLGWTPLSNSLKSALSDFQEYRRSDTMIILVSDGRESCGGDPCGAVRKIRQAGAKAVVHVVGFDVGEEERDQLQCVALAGGGTYYDTTTAKEFRRAIGSIVNDNWVEVLMDTTTLLATFALLAFLVERLTNAMAILFAFSSAWRQHFDVSAAADPDKRIRNDRNRRIALFLVGAAVAIVGALVAQINLLGELGLDAVPQRAGEVVTGLLIASGAEPIRELIQQRARGRDEPPQTTPIQVSGTLVIQQSPSARGENDEKER